MWKILEFQQAANSTTATLLLGPVRCLPFLARGGIVALWFEVSSVGTDCNTGQTGGFFSLISLTFRRLPSGSLRSLCRSRTQFVGCWVKALHQASPQKFLYPARPEPSACRPRSFTHSHARALALHSTSFQSPTKNLSAQAFFADCPSTTAPSDLSKPSRRIQKTCCAYDCSSFNLHVPGKLPSSIPRLL